MIWKKTLRTNLLKNLKKIIQKVVAHIKEASLGKLNKLQDFLRKVASLSDHMSILIYYIDNYLIVLKYMQINLPFKNQ